MSFSVLSWTVLCTVLGNSYYPFSQIEPAVSPFTGV